MSPQDRPLAVMVEDHTPGYETREGIIPAGFYNAGPVVIWDSGDYDLIEDHFEKGKVELILKGKKLRVAFDLTQLKVKGREWLITKKNDAYAHP